MKIYIDSNGKLFGFDDSQQHLIKPDMREATQEEIAAATHYSSSYSELRAAAYPPFTDYLDAKVKQASTDPAIVADGEAQEAAYLEACLAVKQQFPKPEDAE